MVHGFIDPVLELRRFFDDGDIAWCREWSLLHYLASGEDDEGLEANSFEFLHSMVDHLLLHLIEVFFDDLDDVVGVDLKSITCRTCILGCQFDFDRVDVVVHIAIVELLSFPTGRAKKCVDAKIP